MQLGPSSLPKQAKQQVAPSDLNKTKRRNEKRPKPPTYIGGTPPPESSFNRMCQRL